MNQIKKDEDETSRWVRLNERTEVRTDNNAEEFLCLWYSGIGERVT